MFLLFWSWFSASTDKTKIGQHTNNQPDDWISKHHYCIMYCSASVEDYFVINTFCVFYRRRRKGVLEEIRAGAWRKIQMQAKEKEEKRHHKGKIFSWNYDQTKWGRCLAYLAVGCNLISQPISILIVLADKAKLALPNFYLAFWYFPPSLVTSYGVCIDNRVSYVSTPQILLTWLKQNSWMDFVHTWPRDTTWGVDALIRFWTIWPRSKVKGHWTWVKMAFSSHNFGWEFQW